MSLDNLYLDATVFCNLIDDAQTYGDTCKELTAAVRRGSCRIFGSVELLEELVTIAEARGQSGLGLLDLFSALVGKYVLPPRYELLPVEIRKGARLSWSESLLDPAEIREFRDFSRDPWVRAEAAEAIKSSKGVAAIEFDRVRENAQRQLVAEYGTDSAARKKALEFEVTDELVQEWYEYIFRDYHDINGDPINTGPWARVSKLPLTKAYVSFLLARMRRYHTTGAKVDRNDRYDEIHYTHAAIPGTLITEDGGLMRVAESIHNPVVTIIKLADFARSYAQ